MSQLLRHPDHIGSLRDFRLSTGARVACHHAEIADKCREPPLLRHRQKPRELEPLKPIRSRLWISATDIDAQLQGGEEFPILGGLRVIHTPGHTPGSICLFAPQYRLLLVGDALNYRNQNLIPARRTVSSDMPQALASLKTLVDLDFEIIGFGHHQPLRQDARNKLIKLLARYGY